MSHTVALFSLGGAPGVTVTALAMAAVWPEPAGAILVEADASGGDIAAWHQLPPTPGVTDLAAATRHGAGDPSAHTQTLPGGLAVCPGPAPADPAGGAVELLATNTPALHTPLQLGGEGADTRAEPPALVVDLGRLAPRTSTAQLAAHASEVLLLVPEDVAQLRRVKQSAAALADVVARLRVVIIGGSGSTSEIATALAQDLPVWNGRIPSDAKSAAFLRGEAHLSRPARRPLFKSALTLARAVSAPREPVAPPQPPSSPPLPPRGDAVTGAARGHREPNPSPVSHRRPT